MRTSAGLSCCFDTQTASAANGNELAQTPQTNPADKPPRQTSVLLLRLIPQTISQAPSGRDGKVPQALLTSFSSLALAALVFQQPNPAGSSQLSQNHGHPGSQQLLNFILNLNSILQTPSQKPRFGSCQHSVLHRVCPDSSSESSLCLGHGLCQEDSATSLTSLLVGQDPTEMCAVCTDHHGFPDLGSEKAAAPLRIPARRSAYLRVRP